MKEMLTNGKKKCEHLFGKRGKMFREVEMENFGQQNVINDTVIIKKGTLKNFTINVHRLTREIVNTCSEFT